MKKTSNAEAAAEQQILKIDDSYPSIALIGNPNVGKSTIFNALTGLKQHTGNWPGKTVSLAYGKTKSEPFMTIVDLPGTYSLSPHSPDEEVTRDYILFGKYDVVVVVVDATCLQRNLQLVLTTLEVTKHVVLCVNLMDEATRKGIVLDLAKLHAILKIPVVACSANQEEGIEQLLKTIHQATFKTVCDPHSNPYQLTYSEEVETMIDAVEGLLESPYKKRWMALRLLCEDTFTQQPPLPDTIDTATMRECILAQVQQKAVNIAAEVKITHETKTFDRTMDRYLTSSLVGIPLMVILLLAVFYLTMVGANYPSQLLSALFQWMEGQLFVIANKANVAPVLSNVLIAGMFRTLGWVVSVMLPPMAIFFPLFTLLEDFGYLPRIAFNLDHSFQKAAACGKQALTMCMGFGCNAAGVIGCRIISSPRERLIAILTNVFVPCNGRFPMLMVLITIFFASRFITPWNSIVAAILLTGVILLGVGMTLLFSKILSLTLLRGLPSTMILELPPFRKPQFKQVLVRSMLDRTLYVLGRAVSVAAPAGLVIWLFANIMIDRHSVLFYLAQYLNPLGQLMGLDGYILLAFLMGFPANELVIPILMMSYLSSGQMAEYDSLLALKDLLIRHGWTWLTAVNMMILTLFHFPCATTVLTIYRETGSKKWTLLGIALPTLIGIVLCVIVAFAVRLFI